MTQLINRFHWRANSDMDGDVELQYFQAFDNYEDFDWEVGVLWNTLLAHAAFEAKQEDVNAVDLLPEVSEPGDQYDPMQLLVKYQDKDMAEAFVLDVINRIPRTEQRVVDHLETMLAHILRSVSDIAKNPFMLYDASSGVWVAEGKWANERQTGTSVGSVIDRIILSFMMAMNNCADLAKEMVDEVYPPPGTKPPTAQGATNGNGLTLAQWTSVVESRKRLLDKVKKVSEVIDQIQNGKIRQIKSSLQGRLSVSQVHWDNDKSTRWMVLNDGVIDIEEVYTTGRVDLLPFSPWHNTTMALDVKYADVEALGQKKTEWERGVEKLVPDAAVRRYLQKRYGGALRGKPGEVDKSMVWQYGVGDTGKSTIQEAIAGQKGVFSEMSYQADAEVLTKKGAERGATDRFAAYVRGKRFAIISEIDQGAQLNQGKFKQMTGGESVQGTAKYSNEISYFFTASLFVSSNHTPSLPYGDTALSGRIHTVPFETKLIVQSKVSRDEWDATPVEKRADPGWLDRLLTDENERAAIFKWVLEGLVLLGREGLGELPEPIRRAMKQFADEGDPVARIVNSLIGKDDDTSFEQRVVILRDTEWGDRREADGVRELRMEELIKERARALGFADDFGEVSKKQVMAAKKMLHELGGLRKKTYYGTDSTGKKHTGMGFARCLEIDPVAPQAANGSTSAAYATLGI